MNYDELVAYGGLPPRSNGRAVIRSTNGGAAAANVTWQDMTATLGSDAAGINGGHPPGPARGRVRPGQPGDRVRRLGRRRRPRRRAQPAERLLGLLDADVRLQQRPRRRSRSRRPTWPTASGLLSGIPTAITPLNDGLNTIQFQSLSFNPANPTGQLLGGTQDNGTFSYTGSTTWFESVGGDGGQSGFDAGTARSATTTTTTPRPR